MYLLQDWKTAVLLLPFTRRQGHDFAGLIGRLPYYYFLLLAMVSAMVIRLEDCRIITSFY